MIGVYKITNLVNNKCYVGSSIDVIGRWSQHISTLEVNKHHSIKLQRSYNKHGKNNFNYEIIEECDTELLLIREQYYIDLFDSYKNGYNSVQNAGNNLGMKHSDETKEILRNKSKGNKNMLNKKHTDETKKKISDKLKGVPLSEETKLKMSESRKGKKITDEVKKKISDKLKGKPLLEQTKLKISLSHLGKKQSVENIAHRVKLNTGQKRTEESKKKISDKLKGIIRVPMSEERKKYLSTKNCKKIIQLSENDEFIKEYDSINCCARELNLDSRRISDVLCGRSKIHKTFKFKYI
jgi:group I intron endonuclease